MCDSSLFTVIVIEQTTHVHIKNSIKFKNVVLVDLQRFIKKSFAIII